MTDRSQNTSFEFLAAYRKIAETVEHKYGAEAALSFYKMLVNYALDEVEPDILEGHALIVWEHLKPLVDNARIKKPDRLIQAKNDGRKPVDWGRRSISDLEEREIRELWKLYNENGMSYNELKKRFGMHSRSLNERTILEAVGKLRRRDLEADKELLESLASFSGKSEQEWLDNISSMNVSLDLIRSYLEDDDAIFLDEDMIGCITSHPEDYWSSACQLFRESANWRMKK